MITVKYGCLLDIQVGCHESTWIYEYQVQKRALGWRTNLGVISKKVLFRVISLDEIIKGVRVDREEDQQLGSETLESERNLKDGEATKDTKRDQREEIQSKRVCYLRNQGKTEIWGE